jgi:signal transduction histidine kinase
MDQETLNRAFEAFYTTKSKGTGLGLSLCYSIITGHGGTIEINSAPNQGTQVRIFLPLPADDGRDTI